MDNMKDILCPDCEQTKITEQQNAKYGKCMSCFRREVTAKRFNKPYVKFKDLPILEQQQIIYNRATMQSSRKSNNKIVVNNKTNVKRKRTGKYDNNTELQEFIKNNVHKSYSYLSTYAIKNIPGCENVSSSTIRNIVLRMGYDKEIVTECKSRQDDIREAVNYLKTLNTTQKTCRELYDMVKINVKSYDASIEGFRNLLSRYSIPYRRLTFEEKQDVVQAAVDRYQNSIKNTKHKTNKATVYTDDVMDTITSMSTEFMSVREIYETLNDIYPNKGITIANLSNRLIRYNIPYKKLTANERIHNMNKAKQIKHNDDTIDESTLILDEVDRCDNNQHIIDTELDKLEPIKAEIKGVLDRKFTQLNCTVERNYTIKDYLQFLDMLQYLSTNSTYIIRARRDQHDVMNAYQSDIVHEIENAEFEDGNTYFQDKLKLLRKERRYYEHDDNDVNCMKPLLDSIDKELLQNIIDRLTAVAEQRENPTFIPMVDVGMIDKYDWVKAGTLASAKISKAILTTNNRMRNSTRRQTINSKVNTYRVSAKVSGGGYGAFTQWYRDYKSTSEELALECGKKDLEKLMKTKKGMMYTELGVHMINT